MKFRAKIVDASVMRDFTNIANSMSKLAKECVMRMAPKKLYFIVSDEESGTRRPFVWCELSTDFYFKEYSMSGFDDDHNEIYLSLSTAVMLARSLNTVKNYIKSLKIKLTDKQTPCITLEIEQAVGDGTQNRQCVHDIPVEVITRKHWGVYVEPRFNDFHVSIQMPNLRPVKNIVEHMKNISHDLIVSADKHGRLTLQIKTNTVTVAAHFPDLGVESFAVNRTFVRESDEENGEEDEEETHQEVTAVIDVKKFLMFLTGMQVNNSKTICSIVKGKMVRLSLEQPGALSLQCFLTEISV